MFLDKADIISEVIVKHVDSEPIILKSMKRVKANGLYRKNMNANEIVWNGKAFYFGRSDSNLISSQLFSKGLFLYNMVRKDALAFIEAHDGIVDMPIENPVNYTNENYDTNKSVTMLDVNGAYWNIAHILGIISDKTFEKGNLDVVIQMKRSGRKFIRDLKQIRLSALANLGADKEFCVIKDGLITDEVVILKGDGKLKSVYKLIRFACFEHMKKASELLGSDFCSWKTDAIYFTDTDENINKVTEYFESVGLHVK